MPINKYKLLIFDWDGTLVDSIERIVTSLQAASQLVCQLDVSFADARDVIGLGLREAVEKLHPLLDPDLISQVSDAYRHHYINVNPVDEDPFEGVPELLETICERIPPPKLEPGRGDRSDHPCRTASTPADAN